MKFPKLKRKLERTTIVGFILLFLISMMAVSFSNYKIAEAALAKQSRISFTFDDGPLSTYSQAAPTLAKYGITGTAYVPTGCVGSVGTCAADTQSTYMNWTQVQALQNTYKWEIGAHTVDHTPISTLSETALVNQINQSNQAFAARGITPTAFASPEGDYSPSSLATLAKYYSSHRGFHDTGYNAYPYNDYILRVQQVQVGVSVAQVKSYIDTAKANGHWLILVFHEIQPTPNSDPNEYEYATADLDAIAAYSKQQAVNSTKITEGLIQSTANLFPNSSFSSGIAGGWTTDDTVRVKADSTNKGSVPNSTNSVAFSSNTTKNTHLFSPKTLINSADSYVIKQFVKLNTRTSGEVGFYIDEYDINGNWISGQYKGSITWLFPEKKAFTYTPSSSNVSRMSLQVIIGANTGITGYIDNIEMFSTTGSVVVPPTNLINNGTFDSGLSGGWTTDNTNQVTFDSLSNGSPENQVNSIKMNATTSGVHLFSPKVDVSFNNSYSLSVYRNIKSLNSGEIGYYIDEYDINGNWISGQYKTSFYAISSGNYDMSYKPSSTNVTKASLQIFVTGNSGISAFVDNIKWYKI